MNPSNGGVSQSGTSYGSIANYSCDGGYTMNGDANRMCDSDGSWTGDPPKCSKSYSSFIVVVLWLVDQSLDLVALLSELYRLSSINFVLLPPKYECIYCDSHFFVHTSLNSQVNNKSLSLL